MRERSGERERDRQRETEREIMIVILIPRESGNAICAIMCNSFVDNAKRYTMTVPPLTITL